MPFDPDQYLATKGGFDPDAYLNTPQESEWDKAKKMGGKIKDQVVGAAEATAGMIAPLPSQIAGGLYGLGTLLTGQGLDKANANLEKTMDWNFGAGAYVPSTQKGKEYSEKLQNVFSAPGEYAGDVGALLGKQLGNEELGRLSAKLPVDTFMNFLPLGAVTGGAKGLAKRTLSKKEVVPEVKSTISSKLEEIANKKTAYLKQDSGYNAFDKIVESQISGEVSPMRNYADPMTQMKEQLALQKQADIQKVLQERQAQLEYETARQQALDFNAAERARQEAAPTGWDAVIREQLEAQKRQQDAASALESERLQRQFADKTNELTQTELFDQPEMGRVANPYEAKLGDWRVDENGIPIKADLSMEAANLENPLQRNLWGDELQQTRNPVGQNANLFDVNGLQQGIPLTEAIDSMPWAQRRGAIKRELTGDVPASNELQAALAEAERRMGKQQGAINMEAMSEAYNKIKDLTDGIRLAYFGDKQQPKVVAFDKDGNVVGQLDLANTNYSRVPEATDNLSATWVESHHPDLAKKMYFFAAEQGHDIVPSKVQTDAGRQMWSDFEKKGIASNKVIQGQRGAIDVKEVSDAIKKVTSSFEKYVGNISKVDISKEAPPDKADYARRIPGMEKALDGVIPRPKGAEEILKAAEGMKDLPDRFFGDVAMGPELTGEKYSNPVLSGVSSWLQWADKKFDYASRTLVRPVERMIANLNPKSMIDLADVLKTEMFAREKFTPAELAEAGLSQKQIESYAMLREQFDAVYEMQKQALEAQGKKAPTKQEAYLASLRNGNYHVNVKDAKGNTAWHIQARSRFEAQKAIKWLKANVPGLDPNMVIDYRKPNISQNIPKDTLGNLQGLLDIIEPNSDATAAIRAAIRDAQEKAGYDFIGQKNRFLEKANIRGFEGDMPWLSKIENSKRLLQSQIDYLNNAYHWSYMNDAMAEVKNVLGDERVPPNTAEYVKDVVRQQVGLGDQLVKGAEEYVMSRLGLSGSHLNRGASGVGRMTSLVQLGMSPGYMLATPITALYSVAQHMRMGTMSPKMISNSLLDLSAGIVNSLLRERGVSKQLPMTELGKEALKYAEDNGIITKNMFGDLDSITRNRVASQALGAYEATITVPEKIQRLATFMSFVHGLKEKGGYTNMYDLFQRAETLTNIAATNFRASELPLGVQKFGNLGAAAFKYKAPILNYYHQLHMTAMDFNKGKKAPLVTLLGMTAVLGGMQNLPLVNEVDTAWNSIKGALSNVLPQHYGKVSDIDVKDFLRQNLPDFLTHGVVQEWTGAQMSQRFGTDIANLEDPIKNMLPSLGMAGSVLDATGSMMKGDLGQAAWDISPQLARGNLETRLDQFKGIQPGSYRKPSDTSNPDIQQIRTTEDEAYRKMGLRSKEEASRLENRARVNKEQQRINTALDSNMQKLVNNLLKDKMDNVEVFSKAWLKLNPDSQAFESALNSKLEAAALSPEQRDAMKAKTIMQVQRLQKLMR